MSSSPLPTCVLFTPIARIARSTLTARVQYAGWDAEKAVADYWERIRDQAAVYHTVTADEGPFIKVMNVGERIEVNRIEGG